MSILRIFIIIPIFFLFPIVYAQSDISTQINDETDSISEIKEEINTLKTQIANMKSDKNDDLVIDIFQTIGIIGALGWAIFEAQKSSKSNKLKFYGELAAAHREIWTLPIQQKGLENVLSSNSTCMPIRPTEIEKNFITLVIIHLSHVYKASKIGLYKMEQGDKSDIKEFFSKPIPKTVWEQNKYVYNKEFVEFLENVRN